VFCQSCTQRRAWARRNESALLSRIEFAIPLTHCMHSAFSRRHCLRDSESCAYASYVNSGAANPNASWVASFQAPAISWSTPLFIWQRSYYEYRSSFLTLYLVYLMLDGWKYANDYNLALLSFAQQSTSVQWILRWPLLSTAA